MTVRGRYSHGAVELEAHVDWTEGALVSVTPIERSIGIDEQAWQDGPEARRELIARLDTIEPLELTAEEEIAISTFRQQVREASTNAVRRTMEAPQ